MSQSVDDILAGLDFDNVDGSARFPFLSPGKYELALRKLFINQGYKGGSCVANIEVLKAEKMVSDDMPQPIGTMCSTIFKLGGASKAAQMGPNQLAGLLQASTGYAAAMFRTTPEDPLSGKKRIKQLLGADDGSMPEGPLIRLGVRLNAVCYRAVSNGGTVITPVAFSMCPGFTFQDLLKARVAQQAVAVIDTQAEVVSQQ